MGIFWRVLTLCAHWWLRGLFLALGHLFRLSSHRQDSSSPRLVPFGVHRQRRLGRLLAQFVHLQTLHVLFLLVLHLHGAFDHVVGALSRFCRRLGREFPLGRGLINLSLLLFFHLCRGLSRALAHCARAVQSVFAMRFNGRHNGVKGPCVGTHFGNQLRAVNAHLRALATRIDAGRGKDRVRGVKATCLAPIRAARQRARNHLILRKHAVDELCDGGTAETHAERGRRDLDDASRVHCLQDLAHMLLDRAMTDAEQPTELLGVDGLLQPATGHDETRERRRGLDTQRLLHRRNALQLLRARHHALRQPAIELGECRDVHSDGAALEVTVQRLVTV